MSGSGEGAHGLSERKEKVCHKLANDFLLQNEIDLMPGRNALAPLEENDNVGDSSNLYAHGGCHSCHGASCPPSHPSTRRKKAKRTK